MIEHDTNLEAAESPLNTPAPTIRIGHGWDRHRLDLTAPKGKGRPLVIGGVPLEHDSGPIARSDGDVLYHAVTDALLGALGEADIGELFPDTDDRNEGRDSAEFVTRAMELVKKAGWRVGNLDATVVLERPRLSIHKNQIRKNLAHVLGTEESAVNVKGKTGEGVDAVGQGRAVEAHAVVLLMRHSITSS